MKLKCEWCDNRINDFDETCPYCNGVNRYFKRRGTGVPQTMDELKAWAESHNLPLSQMRTYIGENYTGAKAFGIYKDESSGNFIVYKNKADGTRAVRYEGPDEAYAVNELYQKMKERVAEQKSNRTGMGGTDNIPAYENRHGPSRRHSGFSILKTVIISLIVVHAITIVLPVMVLFLARYADAKPVTGYYQYEDEMYYWYDNDWYIYNYADGEWDRYYYDLDYLYDNYVDYRVPSYSYGDYGVTDFTDSDYYEELHYNDSNDWDDDWDSDYDWDDDYDWDSGWDDWDSDW